MAIKAGIWIDHRQAIVVLTDDAGKQIKRIPSGIEKPARSSGRPGSKHKYTPNDFVAEDRLEHKLLGQLKEFYDEVIASVRAAEAILIVGPGEAKGEFMKRLKSKKLRSRIVELETSDKMTDRQLAAKVDEHFAKGKATPKGTANKPTKSSTIKSSTTKRTKKAVK